MAVRSRIVSLLPWRVRWTARRLRYGLADRALSGAWRDLRGEDRAELQRYRRLRRSFAATYASLAQQDTREFTIPLWDRVNAELERRFLPYPPEDFLRDPTVLYMMFVTYGNEFFRQELALVERSFPHAVLARLLREDLVGRPILAEASYPTSENTVHHAYHLARFSASTNCDLGDVHRIVEWGGGYGNLAKLIRRLVGERLTYVIVDTPLFASIQWLYLSSILGEQDIHIVTSPGDPIREGRINLVPVPFVRELNFAADLFISTWALSESSRAVQDLVAERAWFGASHLLIAYQDRRDDIPDAPRTGDLALRSGATIEPMPLLPSSSYAFK